MKKESMIIIAALAIPYYTNTNAEFLSYTIGYDLSTGRQFSFRASRVLDTQKECSDYNATIQSMIGALGPLSVGELWRCTEINGYSYGNVIGFLRELQRFDAGSYSSILRRIFIFDSEEACNALERYYSRNLRTLSSHEGMLLLTCSKP